MNYVLFFEQYIGSPDLGANAFPPILFNCVSQFDNYDNSNGSVITASANSSNHDSLTYMLTVMITGPNPSITFTFPLPITFSDINGVDLWVFQYQ